MLKNIEEVKVFLQSGNKEAYNHENWILKGYKINPELVGSEGVIPVGLQHMSSQDLEAVRDNLCVAGDPERCVDLLIVNLDRDNKSAEELAVTALRWQGLIEHAVILLVSKFDKRILEAEQQLEGKEILNNDALILVRLD